MKILLVLNSHDQLGSTGKKTGFWLEELAAPYYRFKDTGVEITLASPNGGQPPLDPKSNEPDFQTASTRRFETDAAAMGQLACTKKLSEVSIDDYDAVFYPGGGHGPVRDLSEDKHAIVLIERAAAIGKPVGAVRHAPAVFRHVNGSDGKPFVRGKRVTGFTNTEEEEAVGLTKVVPFFVEDMLQGKGGVYTKGADWSSHVVTDGLLVTGQNPQSSEAAAQALLDLLRSR